MPASQQVLEIDFRALGDSLAQLPAHILLSADARLWPDSSDYPAATSAQDIPPQSSPVRSQAESSVVAEHSRSGNESPRSEPPGQPLEPPDEELEQLLASTALRRTQQSPQAAGSNQEMPSSSVGGIGFSSSSHKPQIQARGPDPELELDELLGMCNVEAPALPTRQEPSGKTRDRKVFSTSKEEAGEADAIAKARTKPVSAVDGNSEQTKQPPAVAPDLEDWLNSL